MLHVEIASRRKQAGRDPADRAGAADAEKAPHTSQDEGRQAAEHQLDDAADERHAGNPHALQGVTVDKDLPEKNIKGHRRVQVQHGLLQEQVVVLCRKDGNQLLPVKQHGPNGKHAEAQRHEGTLADALADAVVFLSAVILRRVDGHGDTEGNHGLQRQLFNPRRRDEARNGFGAKGIADRLNR